MCNAQVKLLSWNLENFGKSKSDTEITYIAHTVKDFDIVAIQEVATGYGGAQAVATLADELNRKDSKWDYTISDSTSSSAYKKERYAFIWKTSFVKKIGKAWLEKKCHLEIDREPFYCTFEHNKKQFTVANFHAITKNKQPETEIKYFKFLPAQYPELNLIFLSDFNCPQSHIVFNELMVKEFFNQGQQNLNASLDLLKEKLKEINLRIEKLEDLFVDGNIEKQNYIQNSQRYSETKEEILRTIEIQNSIGGEYKSWLKSGVNLLADIKNHYFQSDVTDKQKLISSIFPEKISFNGDKCRTTRINDVLRRILQINNDLVNKKSGQL